MFKNMFFGKEALIWIQVALLQISEGDFSFVVVNVVLKVVS